MHFPTVDKTAWTGKALELCFFHTTVVAYQFSHGSITRSVVRVYCGVGSIKVPFIKRALNLKSFTGRTVQTCKKSAPK